MSLVPFKIGERVVLHGVVHHSVMYPAGAFSKESVMIQTRNNSFLVVASGDLDHEPLPSAPPTYGIPSVAPPPAKSPTGVNPVPPPAAPPEKLPGEVEAAQIDVWARAKFMERQLEALDKQAAQTKETIQSIIALGAPSGGLRAMLHKIREEIPQSRLTKLEADYASMDKKLSRCEAEANHRETRMVELDRKINQGQYAEMHKRFEDTASLLAGLKAYSERLDKDAKLLQKRLDELGSRLDENTRKQRVCESCRPLKTGKPKPKSKPKSVKIGRVNIEA